MDASRLAAKTTRRYDLEGMPDEEFERMCARLVRIEFPLAVRPASTGDGGADVRLPGADDTTERSWQAKHFPKRIHWDKCKESLERCRRVWDPRHYTFCFPRRLSEKEQKTFDRHFRNSEVDIEVDHWNAEELEARLDGSELGQGVAHTFFEDPALDKERMARAFRAQGPLDTTGDALERMLPVGDFLRREDAYFFYPATTHQTGGPAPPPTPGTVMSVAHIEGSTTSRVDAVPRDEEALERYGPEITLRTTADEAGERAAELLRPVFERGEPVRLQHGEGSGLDVSFTNVPPALEHLVAEHEGGGYVELGATEPTPPPPPPPWQARLHVETDRGQADLDVRLEPGGQAPPDWDGVLEGSVGGMDVRALFWRRADRGQIRFDFTYRFASPASLKERVKALHAFAVLHGEGRVVITDHGSTGRPEMNVATAPRELPRELSALSAFIEDLLSISDWAGVVVDPPEQVEPATIRAVASVARMIREGGQLVRWDYLEPVVTPEGIAQLQEGGRLLLEQPIGVKIEEQTVDLGFTRMVVDEYKIAAVVEERGGSKVRLEPPDTASAEIFQTLHRVRQPTASAPPGSPRKGARKRKRKGRKGRRR